MLPTKQYTTLLVFDASIVLSGTIVTSLPFTTFYFVPLTHQSRAKHRLHDI